MFPVAQAVGASGLLRGLRAQPDVAQSTLEELLAPDRWRRKARNPELKKALGYVQGVVAEARRLLSVPSDAVSLRTPQLEARLRDVLDLRVESLTIDATWELYTEVKSLLPWLANTDYIALQLDHEAQRAKDASRWHGWTQHFSKEELQRLRGNYAKRQPSQVLHGQAAEKLAFLYGQRAEAGRDRRAKAAQKCRYLNALWPILLLLQAGLVVAIEYFDGADVWKRIAIAGTAGALGATLSGTMRIRDDLRELDDLRSFWPAMRIQPLVGATAGLIVLLVLESGALDLGGGRGADWAASALLAFAAGFSEPFFLGVIQRVAVISDKNAAKAG